MVPPTEAAEVLARRLAADPVRHHVIEVGPGCIVPAAGMAAGAVTGADEPALRWGSGVPTDRRWTIQHGAAAPLVRMVRAAAAGQPLQLRAGDGGAQGAADGVDQGDAQRALGRRLQPAWAEGVQLLEQ